MSKSINIELTRCSFCVPLTNEQWDSLTARNDRGDDVHEVATGYETPEVKKLLEAGCLDLEWNGHFGRNLFFSAAAENVGDAKKAIEKFVRGLDNKKGG